MKKVIFTTAIALSAFTISCKDNTKDKINDTIKTEAAKEGLQIEDTDKTGTFSFDGKSFSAPVETQYFGDKEKGNFSVLCQHNESDDPENANHELLQLIFLTEKDANTSQLKIYDGGSSLPMTEPEPGIVGVSLTGVGNGLDKTQYTGTEKSTGTITVKNRTVTLKDVVLFNSDGDKKVVNATLPY